jgi:hypothetical protein
MPTRPIANARDSRGIVAQDAAARHVQKNVMSRRLRGARKKCESRRTYFMKRNLGILGLVAISVSACSSAGERNSAGEEAATGNSTNDAAAREICAVLRCPRDPEAADHPGFLYSDAETQRYAAGRISETGTRRIEGNKIWIESTTKLNAPASDVMTALLANWERWWRHGTIETAPTPTNLPFTVLLTYSFKPIGFGITVVAAVGNPIWARSGDTETYTIPVDLTGDFVGPEEFVVTSTPAGGSTLVARWMGVENRTILPTNLSATLHFKTEDGTNPMRLHTGYAGLIGCVERGDCIAADALPPAPPPPATCLDCVRSEGSAGWCSITETCEPGTSTSSLDGTCGGPQWIFSSSDCP